MVGIGALVAASAIQASRADDVVARSIDILSRATSVSGSFTQTFYRLEGGRQVADKGVGRGRFDLKKDRFMRVVSDFVSEFSNGTQRTSVFHKDDTYRVQDERVFELLYLPGFEAFSTIDLKLAGQNQHFSLLQKMMLDQGKNDDEKKALAGQMPSATMDTVDGKPAVVYVIGGSRVFLDPKTAMPLGADFIGEDKRGVHMRFRDVQIDSTVADNSFTYRPTGDVKKTPVVEGGMRRVGDRIPSGSESSMMHQMSTILSQNKTTIVLFFDRNNAADGEILEKFSKIAAHGLPQGVGLVGVARTKDWQDLFDGRPKFQVITDGELPGDRMADGFGITRYPTVYIVDDTKTVKFVQIGSGTEDLDPVLRFLGIAQP